MVQVESSGYFLNLWYSRYNFFQNIYLSFYSMKVSKFQRENDEYLMCFCSNKYFKGLENQTLRVIGNNKYNSPPNA